MKDLSPSLPELSPICETPGRRRGSVDYCNSSRLPRLRGIGKMEVEEVGREEEQGEENHEERRQQTVDMSMDAFEQVKSFLCRLLKLVLILGATKKATRKRSQERGLRHQHHWLQVNCSILSFPTHWKCFSGRGEDETDSRDITGSWTQVAQISFAAKLTG